MGLVIRLGRRAGRLIGARPRLRWLQWKFTCADQGRAATCTDGFSVVATGVKADLIEHLEKRMLRLVDLISVVGDRSGAAQAAIFFRQRGVTIRRIAISPAARRFDPHPVARLQGDILFL